MFHHFTTSTIHSRFPKEKQQIQRILYACIIFTQSVFPSSRCILDHRVFLKCGCRSQSATWFSYFWKKINNRSKKRMLYRPEIPFAHVTFIICVVVFISFSKKQNEIESWSCTPKFVLLISFVEFYALGHDHSWYLVSKAHKTGI